MTGIKNGRAALWILLLTMIFIINPIQGMAKQLTVEEIKEKVEHIVEWKKTSLHQSIEDPLFSNIFLENAGKTAVDWYSFGLGRIGYPDDYIAYTAMIEQVVDERYKTPEKLSASKATEWHRIALAYLAVGGNAEDIAGHNLIADGTYNRGKTAALESQGINGVIWGLITVDALKYDIPKEATDTRKTMIQKIIRAQLKSGAFSFDRSAPNVDMTAMAITALAPYYNDDAIYNGKTVQKVIDVALQWLSKQQQQNGDYKSDGTPNLESTAQVLVALTALHIDIFQDNRFIKQQNTVVDGMLRYEQPDGGFVHAKTYNKNNPSSQPNESNTMASEQALYAFVALYREMVDERTLFDFRKPQSKKVKSAIAMVEQQIDTLKKHSENIHKVSKLIEKVPMAERSYISNYNIFKEIAKEYQSIQPNMTLTKNMHLNEHVGQLPQFFTQNMLVSTVISKEHVLTLRQILKQPPSTAQTVEIAKLEKQWAQAENAKDYKKEANQIAQRQKAIIQLKNDIKQLNERILDELYPFTNLSLKDEKNVSDIVKAYHQLPIYDRQQIIKYADVEKAEAQMATLKWQRWLKIGGMFLLISLIGVWVSRRRKKHQVEDTLQ